MDSTTILASTALHLAVSMMECIDFSSYEQKAVFLIAASAWLVIELLFFCYVRYYLYPKLNKYSAPEPNKEG